MARVAGPKSAAVQRVNSSLRGRYALMFKALKLPLSRLSLGPPEPRETMRGDDVRRVGDAGEHAATSERRVVRAETRNKNAFASDWPKEIRRPPAHA